MHSQAIAYAKLAQSEAVKNMEKEKHNEEEAGLFTVLPVSAESTGMLPNRNGNVLQLKKMMFLDYYFSSAFCFTNDAYNEAIFYILVPIERI